METWIEEPSEVYRGSIFSVLGGTVRLDDGTTAKREIVHHPGSVAVVAISGDKVLLTTQSRIVAGGQEILEIPAGRIDVKKGETPRQAALRELEEETGYRGRLEPGPVYYSSIGFIDELVHIFFVLNAEKIPDAEIVAKPDHDEKIELRWIPLAEVEENLNSYKFTDSKTIIGLREVLSRSTT